MKRIKYVTIEEMNEVLKDADKYTHCLEGEWDRQLSIHSLACNSYIKDAQVQLKVTTKYHRVNGKLGVPCTYILRKDGDVRESVLGQMAYILLQKYYNSPVTEEYPEIEENLAKSKKGTYYQSASPLVGYNPEYDNREDYVYVYDLNSAYAQQLMGRLPDTRGYRLNGFVREGREVGFMFDEDLTLRESGFADIVFPLMDSPYKRFAQTYYHQKRYGKTEEERSRAKAYLVYGVGYWQLKNPFLRAYIVHRCNNYIKNLIDKDTIMWNTDAIYSLRPRDDIPIGLNIGEFKLEYQGLLRHKGCNYQKVGERPSVRGVCKNWFDDDFNLLTDDLPKSGNIYKYDKENNRVVQV